MLLLPPAPAALVEFGRADAALSALSAAAFRRRAVAGPPGGFGDERPVELPVVAPAAPAGGAVGGGDDYWTGQQILGEW